MTWIDWLIVLIPLIVITGLAFYAKRYARSVVDFLASGRVAGRYVLCVGDLAAELSVITLVAGCEQNYQTGYGVGFWASVATPIWLILSLTGYCSYRWRETRCLSRGQFIEMRYGSKFFRIVTAAICTFAEAVTNAIGPAIAANFFIYFLKLPHRIMICGVSFPCYIIIVALCLILALLIIWPAGRISLLITDSFQGIISYPIFVLIVGFILLKFGWNTDITETLWDRVPDQSFIDPFDVENLRDFNIFALVVSIFGNVIGRANWIGNDTTNSARTPHEQKMAGILGAWRNGFAYVMVMLIAVMVYAFMNSEHFAVRGENQRFRVTNDDIRRELSIRVFDEVIPEDARRTELSKVVMNIPDQHRTIGVDEPLSQNKNLDTLYYRTVKAALGESPEARFQFQQYRTLYCQMMMPVVLSNILPTGMLGLFCLLMVMLLISTDDSRIFNSAGCLVQDVFLPFFKKKLPQEKHLLLLRLTSVGVTLFFFAVAACFQNLDYINMFTTIMCSLWCGGAGPIMIFGLYSRFGNLAGAWCAIIFGSGTSLLGLILQRTWTLSVYPWMESHGWVPEADRILRLCSSPFEPWIHWEMSDVKFPINSVEISAISLILALVSYIVASFLTYKPYNLDKLLHRGIYSDGESLTPEPWRWSNLLSKLITITPEYTRGDKILTWVVFFYSFVYAFGIMFFAVAVSNLFFRWPKEWWNVYFFIQYLLVPGVIGVVSTFWFMIGGIKDMRQLFIDLAAREIDPEDNGQVSAEEE